MKSAYELAMERLQQQSPSLPVSQKQKEALAELESVFRAKIAERELAMGDEIQAAEISGNYVLAEDLRERLTQERLKLEVDRETKKEAIRQEK
jgi:hypothetical protein